MIAARRLFAPASCAALLGLGFALTAGTASAAGSSSTIEFPKQRFDKCFNGAVAECAEDLHLHFVARRRAAKPACKKIWPENSTERFICDYLFGALVATGVAPPKSRCEEQKESLKKRLNACLDAHAMPLGSCDCDKAKSDAQAVEDLKKELAAAKEADDQCESRSQQTDAALAKCKKDLAAAQPLAEMPISNTFVRVGVAAIVGPTSAPALTFDVAHRLWGTDNLDLDVALNTENFLLQNQESGLIASGGLELDWLPHRTEDFSWGLGGQLAYAAVMTGHATNWTYGNGGWLGIHFLAQWRVAPEYSLGFRINANGLATTGPVYYGIFGLDFVVEHHEPQGS